MNDLFLFWLSLSISGTLVALTLFLLKPLLRQFSKTWQYYLWLLVVLRLLIPFSPEVCIVGSLFGQVQTYFTVQSEPADQVPEFDFPVGMPSPAVPDIGITNPQESSAAITGLSVLKNHVWGALWLSVAMILLARKVVGYGRFLKVVKRESKIIVDGQTPVTLQAVRTAMGMKKQILVCTNPLVRAPMLVGFIRPIIVLPHEDIRFSELTFILRHELTHDRRMDFLYKWLAEVAVCLHWFNPVAYWVRKQINQDCEFSCDETVIACSSVEERQTYGETLLNSIVINRLGVSDIASLSLNKDGKLIKERLSAIMKYHRKPKWFTFVASLLTFVLLCGTVFAGAYTVAAVENTNTNQPPLSKSDLEQSHTTTAQTIVYENVEIRHNGGKE